MPHFRLPVPAQPASAKLFWRGRSLGQIVLPILGPEEFTKKLSLQMPTASVRIGDQAVACQTYVTTQCQGLIVSALLQSPTSLVPIVDLGIKQYPTVGFFVPILSHPMLDVFALFEIGAETAACASWNASRA